MPGYDFSKAFATSFAAIGGDTTEGSLLELLKLFLGIPPDDTSKDEELTRALNFAGDMVETYLDRVIAKRPVDEYFPHHFGTVELHNMPVDLDAPLSVFLDGVLQSDYKPYLYRGKTCKLTRIGHDWDTPLDWRRFEQVTVTYTAGFDPLPSDIAYAMCIVAAGIYQAEGTGQAPGGATGAVKRQAITGVGSVEYDVGGASAGSGAYVSTFGAISSTAAQMLSRYVRMSC